MTPFLPPLNTLYVAEYFEGILELHNLLRFSLAERFNTSKIGEEKGQQDIVYHTKCWEISPPALLLDPPSLYIYIFYSQKNGSNYQCLTSFCPRRSTVYTYCIVTGRESGLRSALTTHDRSLLA